MTIFDQSPTLITVAGHGKTRNLFIEREYDSFIYQYTDHNQNLYSIWNFSFKKDIPIDHYVIIWPSSSAQGIENVT